MHVRKLVIPIILALFVLIPAIRAVSDSDEVSPQKLITANFQDTDVREAIKVIFENTGLLYTLDQSVQGKVTLSLEDQSFQDALAQVLDAANLKVRMQDDTYIISPIDKVAPQKPLPIVRKSVRKDLFAADLGPVVRVGLTSSIGKPYSATISCGSELDIANESGEVLGTVPPDSETTLCAKDGGIEVTVSDFAPLALKGAVRVVPEKNTSVISIIQPSARCKRYRGVLEFRGKVGLTVIDELPLEDYVRGVVPFEVDPSFQPEAQKALTVAIRTYALRHLGSGRHSANGFNLCDSTDCQGFAGAFRNNPWVDKLVDGTRGQIVMYKGKPIYATYSTDCGGATEDNEDGGFGSDPWPYLRTVADNPGGVLPTVAVHQSMGDESTADDQSLIVNSREAAISSQQSGSGNEAPSSSPSATQATNQDDYCASCPFHLWSKTYTVEQLQSKFSRSHSTTVGKFQSMEFTEFDPSGRVRTVLIKGDKKEVRITGNRFRDIFGAGSIKSTLLTLTVTPGGDYTINGKGYGHGVGLCAWGANGLAKSQKGIAYTDILKHYYTGVDIQTIYGKSIAPAQTTPIPQEDEPSSEDSKIDY